MIKNMGIIDRFARVIIAGIIAVLFYQDIISGYLGTVLVILGFVFVLTSLFSFCPLYSLFGIKTCKTK